MIDENYILFIGGTAVLLTTIRLLPQIIKSFKTKSVDDISFSWEVMGVLSAGLWSVYGVLRNDAILIIGAITLMLSFLILIFQKIIYRRH